MSDEKQKPMSDEEILQAIDKLPNGTREKIAFEQIPHGRTQAEFRHIWLHDHLCVNCRNDKASVSADAAVNQPEGDAE